MFNTMQLQYLFTFTHWWTKATIVAKAALRQIDRNKVGHFAPSAVGEVLCPRTQQHVVGSEPTISGLQVNDSTPELLLHPAGCC